VTRASPQQSPSLPKLVQRCAVRRRRRAACDSPAGGFRTFFLPDVTACELTLTHWIFVSFSVGKPTHRNAQRRTAKCSTASSAQRNAAQQSTAHGTEAQQSSEAQRSTAAHK